MKLVKMPQKYLGAAIYFTQIDADLVDEIISNIGYYASEKDLEGIKEEVHRYVLYRTQK